MDNRFRTFNTLNLLTIIIPEPLQPFTGCRGSGHKARRVLARQTTQNILLLVKLSINDLPYSFKTPVQYPETHSQGSLEWVLFYFIENNPPFIEKFFYHSQK